MQEHVQGKVDSRAMREVNRSIVLDIIRRGGRVSRTDLARRSTLTKPTVSAIVEELIARGIVHEVGYGKTVASGGRRARLLEFNDHSAAYLGIRFGVHTTSVGIADARGEIRAMRETATIHGDARRSLAQAVALVDELVLEAGLPRERLQAAGVTVPGLVDQGGGEVTLAPNLDWSGVPMRALAQDALGIPVVVNNVTNAGAIAEGRVGAARGVRSFVWVYVGSGIGAGIMIDGQLFHGHRGCVANAARAGDEVARRISIDASEYLGVGISFLMNVLNPEMVVLGGAVTEALEPVVAPLRTSVEKHTLESEAVKIVASSLGDSAPLIGAVLAAMDLSVRSYRVVSTGERLVG